MQSGGQTAHRRARCRLHHAAMSVLRAAFRYFAVVFAVGFVLGAIRVTLIVPRLGERGAELLELPFMVAVIVLVARGVARRTAAFSAARQLVVGGIALLLMLAAEIGLGMVSTGRSPTEVVLSHDPVSGAFYYAALLAFALLPWWWSRRLTAR